MCHPVSCSKRTFTGGRERSIGAIFISYRRDDTDGQAGRLFDELSHQFGAGAVFMDVAAIEPGRDFRTVIDEHVASCGVLLAVIGPNWLTAADGQTGARRLDDAQDFVRLETAAALKRDIPVVPVLVKGARMPRADQLPDDLKELAFRNGVELTHQRWTSDVQVLIKALQPRLAAQPATESAVSPAVPAAPRRGRWIAAGLAVTAVAVGLSQLFTRTPVAVDEAQTELASPQRAASAATSGGVGSFNVDFFYCEAKLATSEPIARSALSLKQPSDTGRWSVKLLSARTNQQPGYGIRSSVVRFTPPEERSVADSLAKLLATKGVKLQFQEISYPTPGYVSVFICE